MSLIVLSANNLCAQSKWQKVISIYFDVDQDVISENFKYQIRDKFLEIGTSKIKEIKIIGNADEDAAFSYNLELSERRAKNTETFLLSQGVKESMISIESLGESKPISTEKSINRRVDLIITYERRLSDDEIMKKKVVQGLVFNELTKERIQTELIIELENKQQNTRTNAKGYFRLTCNGSNDVSLTFVKDGYLNAHQTLMADEIATSEKDTIQITVYLKPVEVVEKITLKNIYFYTDTDVLKPESYPDLEKLLKTMKDHDDMLIEIQGHMNFAANRLMTPKQQYYNLSLSHKRAKAIYNYLVTNGIERKRLSYRGMSNLHMIYPIPKNQEEEDMNKRVEIYSLRIINS